jgi:hypothetical protein
VIRVFTFRYSPWWAWSAVIWYARQKKGGETVSEKRIAHDFAWAATFDVIDGLRPVLRDEEVHDCFEMIYERFKSAIEAAFDTRSRELHRLNPSKN